MLHHHCVDFEDRVHLFARKLFHFSFFSEEPSLKPNLDTKTNIVFYKRTRMSRGEVPAVNIELCVCVFRARSMTEQQEQSEETGLVSTQDLDHSKDDDTHGHFRQISHTQTHTLFCNTCCLSMLFFFHPHTICILCMVMGYSPRRFIFTALILCFYFRCIWSQTIVACMQTKRTANRDSQRTLLFP